MKLALTLLFTTVLSFGYAQISESEIIGTWTVKEGMVPDGLSDPNAREMMEFMIEAFSKAVFGIHEGGTFNFQFTGEVPPYMEELSFLDNTNWKFDEETSTINVGTEADFYTLMSIHIAKNKEDWYFILDDSPIALHVIKE